MTIDDLKNNGNTSGEKREPFIPTVEQDGGSNDPFIPSVSQEATEVRTGGKNSFSMMTGKSTPRPESGERVKADLSDLPQTNYEDAGVDKKESIEAEILGPGGDFEKYLAEKSAEMKAYNDDYDLRQEMGENPEDATEEEVVETDEDEIERELQEVSNTSYSAPKTFIDEEEEETEMGGENEEVVDQDAFEAGKAVAADFEGMEFENDDVKEAEKEVKASEIEGNFPDHNTDEDEQIVRNTITVNANNSVLEDDEAELDSSEEIEEEGMTDDQRVEIMKKMITEKIKPVSKKLDISTFTVAKKGTSNMNLFAVNEVSTARWVLPTTGIIVDMKEILGSELDKIRAFANAGDARGLLNIIYNNIVSPKPTTFEAWMKSIAYDDYDHLFMAIYVAAFNDANYLPGDCENKSCKEKMYVTDNIPVMEMVKFKDDKAKAKFKKIMKESPTDTTGAFATEIVPISENCAIGFKIPTLYSTIIESSYLDDTFTEKYRDMVAILPYVSDVYKIDYETHTLIPVEYKVYSNNVAKTVKSKVIYYNKALASLSADEITVLKAYINNINDKSDDITYQIPETTCPHCGHKNPAQLDQSASSLVFLRNQLALLVTT